MKRKTNLFYDAGQDSNFVTFSNYTESLTGNILSLKTKLFPSKFICMYVPSLDIDDTSDTTYTEEKSKFITEWLSGYYENKLATLRDYCIETTNIKIEQLIHPLKYLLDTIVRYDENSVISFIGDICEQEYNGVFMDNICIIENNAQAIYRKYIDGGDTSEQVPVTGSAQDFLHGWENARKMPDMYENIVPKYDSPESIGEADDGEYACIYYTSANGAHIEEISDYSKDIKFNVLIPLFTIMSDGDGVVTSDRADIDDLLILDSASYNNQYDTPFGMWFSDKVITLERSDVVATTYRPSWSLCISAQFKPFPYSDKYPNEITDYNNPDKFATFALVLAKQAALLNEISSLKETMSNSRSSNIVYSLDAKTDNTITSSQLAYVNSRIDSIDAKIAKMSFDSVNNINSELTASLRRTQSKFNEAYDSFLLKSDYIENAYSHFSQSEESLNSFDERYVTASEQFNDIQEKYGYFTGKFAYFDDSYSYYAPSVGYFNESYGYFAPCMGFFNESYGYFSTSFAYFVPTYSYFANEYPYFRQIIAEEHWSEQAYAYATEAYNSYYVPSYNSFLVDYGKFRNAYDTYYVPSYSYFNNAYGYFYGSYGYFYDSYGYFTSTYNSYLTPAYGFFTYAYQYFVDVMAKEWWAHDAYSYMSEAYATYMIPSYGYFVPQVGYFRPNIGYFRSSYGFFDSAYNRYFVPSYNYFRLSYPYFEEYYPKFEEFVGAYEYYWNDFGRRYDDFVPKYDNFNERYLSREEFQDTYSYAMHTYYTGLVPEMTYFRASYAFFKMSYDNGSWTFVPSYTYFSKSYNKYLNSYDYFTEAYDQFNLKNAGFTTKYNKFTEDYARFDSFKEAYDDMQGWHEDFNDSYNGFNASYASFNNAYTAFNSTYNSIDERINGTNDLVNQLTVLVQDLRSEVQTLKSHVSYLENELN